jgi:uncharacterized membrane protein
VDMAAYVTEFLHIFAEIFWFGSVLYSDFILIPSLMSLPPATARPASLTLVTRSDRVMPGVAIGVIVLGFIRGTVFGPIKSVDVLVNTHYGITWLVALILAVVTLLWGLFMLGRYGKQLFSDDANWVFDAQGQPPAATQVLIGKLRRNGMIELGLFLLILVCMVAMSMGE